MENEKITSIIQSLNKLLDMSSLHALSYEWDKVAEVLRKEKLKIEVIESKTYYLDEELDSLHKEGLGLDLLKAAELRVVSKNLLEQKAGTESAVLRMEPCYFEFKNNKIIGYLCKNKENQRLLWNLMEAYQIAAMQNNFS